MCHVWRVHEAAGELSVWQGVQAGQHIGYDRHMRWSTDAEVGCVSNIGSDRQRRARELGMLIM